MKILSTARENMNSTVIETDTAVRVPQGSAMARSIERTCTTASSLIAPAFVAAFAPLVLLTNRKVQRVLLATLILNIPLQVGNHFFYQEAAEKFGSIGGLEISLSNIALALLYFGWLIQGPSRGLNQRSRSKVTVPALLLVVSYAFSLLVATDVILGIFEVWKVLELFLLYVYIANTVTSRDDMLFVVRLLLIGLIIEASLMLAQAAGLVGDFNLWGLRAKTDLDGSGRISGNMGSPNLAASYLAMSMTVALGVMFARVTRADKFLSGVGLGMATIPLISTMSRGGWIAFCVGVSVIAMSYGLRNRLKAVASALLFIIVLAIPFAAQIQERLSGDDYGAAASRIPLNKIAFLMIEDHPLFGVGANNFPVAMAPYVSRGFLGEFLYTVHNKYLVVCAETGIWGLIAFVWLLIAIIYQGLRCARLHDPLLSALAVGFTAAVLGLMAHMFFDVFREGSAYRLLWIFGGLGVAMNRMTTGPIRTGVYVTTRRTTRATCSSM